MRFWVMLAFISLISCKKDSGSFTPIPLDLRNNWIGSYFCNRENTFWMMGQPNLVTMDTLTLTVTKDPDTAGYLWVGQFRFWPDTSGHFITSGNGFRYWEIQFRNDSLYLNTANGGLGGGNITHYIGKKVPR